MKKLHDRTALVTASGRNIGRAVALRLAKEGANVIINARSSRDEAERVAAEARDLGVSALAVIADVGDRDQVKRMVAAANDKFGSINILVNLAASRPHKPFVEQTLSEWDEVRSIILDGPYHLTHLVVPAMIENGYGRILYFTGTDAYTGAPKRAHVSAAKMGLVGMARSLATELAPHNIRVNVISPGTVDTQRGSPEWYHGKLPDATGIPLGRMASTDELAAAALFLIADDCNFITGETLHVNGGYDYV